MRQDEIRQAIEFAVDFIKGTYVEDCDESWHLYWTVGDRDILIGGWAGDRHQYFWEHSDESARILRMMDV